MKNIYHVVIAVLVLTQIKISLAHEDNPSRRKRGAAGAASGNAVNAEFRRGYNVAANSPVLQQNTNRARHNTCEAPKVCKAPTFPGLEDYTDFMFNFSNITRIQLSPHETMENDCSCLNDKFREELGPRFLMEMNKERKALNDKILKSASKKFLNDYASNIEDASFFLLKTSGVFKDQESAKDIQCNDSKRFDDMIFATCGNDVAANPAKFEEKKLALLNALGGASRPGMNFDQRIRDISRQIQYLPIPGETTRDGKQVKYSRTIYDNTRIGLSRSPEGQFVEHLIQKMIQHPEIENQLRNGLVTKTPVEAILSVLEGNLGGSVLLDKIGADKSITGNELTNISEIREDFKFLMQTHPGFLNVMGRISSFRTLMNAVKANPRMSLLEQIETNPDVLGPLLISRCVDLTKQFADVVCTKDDDLIKSVDASDLEELMHVGEEKTAATEGPQEPELHELLMCQESGKEVKAAFSHMSDLEKEDNYTTRRSDYLERLIEPDIEKHKNLFSVTMLKSARDKSFRRQMEKYADAGRAYSSSIKSPGIVAYDVYAETVADGNDFSIGKPILSRSEAKDYLKAASMENSSVAEFTSKSSEPDQVAVATETRQDTQEQRKVERRIASEGPMTSYSSGAMRNSANAEKPADEQRQNLSRDLAKSNPEPEVQKHVSRLDDQTISELTNLRNLNSTLMSRMIADEEKKLQEYRERLSGISERMPVQEMPVAQNVSVPEVVSESVSTGGVVERAPQESTTRSVAGAGRTLPVVSGTAVSAARVEEEGGPQIDSSRRGGESTLPQENSSSGDFSLTLVSNQRAETSDLRPEAIESEVSTYFEAKALAPHEFEDLIKNGLKYRYQVVVNDVVVTKEKVIPFNSLPLKTRRDLETRYTRDRLENQTSKLAVLRMLMNSTVVR